jgi:Ca2+-binding EF-hand superfamily protein
MVTPAVFAVEIVLPVFSFEMTRSAKIRPDAFVLTDAESTRLGEWFNVFDKTCAGTIDAEEVRVALRVLGFDPPDDEVRETAPAFERRLRI